MLDNAKDEPSIASGLSSGGKLQSQDRYARPVRSPVREAIPATAPQATRQDSDWNRNGLGAAGYNANTRNMNQGANLYKRE